MTTPRDDISGLSERLRKTLAGVEPDDFGGDNLAIFIASELEPSIDDETLDDSGTWKQGAIDACDRVLDAIHAHYATTIDALQADNHVKEQDIADMACTIYALQVRVKELEAERDEARKAADLGCDANNGGPHSVITDRSYKFCGDCGETIKNPTLQERARAAEARATRLQQERDEAYERAAKIIDAECDLILSKQTPTNDPLSMEDAVNQHLRMIACILPDLAAAIRQLAGPEKEGK